MESRWNEIQDFINNNALEYLSFLSRMKGFPSVCDYSSEILGAYLSVKYDLDLIYIEGNYIAEDNGHFWLDVEGNIIDFTLCQYSPKKKLLKSMSKEEIFKMLVIENQIAIVIGKEDELYGNYIFLDEHYISEDYLNLARNSASFGDYLALVKKSKKNLFKK